MNTILGIEAVILGLDPAKHTSGAVIIAPDYGNPMVGEEEHPFDGNYALHEFGKVETQPERERFVESFLDLAIELDLPLIAIAEEWDPPRHKRSRDGDIIMDPKWTYPTVLGIGEGWGRWAAELESASAFLVEEQGYPPIPVERATPNTWRDDMWGPRRAKDSMGSKEQACRYFQGVFGYAASPDISEAGCIALWGTVAPAVRSAVESWMKDKPKPKSKSQRKKERKRRAS